MDDPLGSLIDTYHELNAAVVDELHEEPSALEFMRYVATNRPFVVRRATSDWQAHEKWSLDYLRQAMDGEEVKVAVTPFGNADAVVEQKDGTMLFVEPYETFAPFYDFLTSILTTTPGVVSYAQTQNDNLRSEYANLLQDVPADIPFARIALGQSADAVNLWLGNDRSTTALHKDNYENVYVQVRGQKHFVLLPPVEVPCVNEQMLRRARYVPRPPDQQVGPSPSPTTDFDIHLNDEDTEPVPVATWDPDEPNERTTPYSRLAKPLRVTLNEGDMLYLPSMWYHKVMQTVGEEGFACAVNYWYDMDFAGHHWASNSFVRDVYWAEQKRPGHGKLETGEDPVGVV